MSITLEWNDKGLQEIFKSLDPKIQAVYHKQALRNSGNKIKKIVQKDASSAGLGANGQAMEKNGWRWIRYGRVSRSVKVGKTWVKGTKTTMRVFNQGSKRLGFLNSAPHAHLAILGHVKHLPRRNGTTYVNGRVSGVPIYQAAFSNADIIFEKELEASVARMVKKLNKAGKL